MDINLARTFIEVVTTGSFVKAAKRLNVTQSTVSVRIQALEDQLGRRLFVRNKAGAALTPAGEQFQHYAISLTQVWEQACHHIAVPSGYRTILAVGGQLSLWDGYLMKWLSWMRARVPDVSLRAEYGQPERLMIRLVEGHLDIGIMYTPQSRPGLNIELLFEEELIAVSTTTSGRGAKGAEYVFVDWGPEFRAVHSLSFPEFANPGMFLSLGSHALHYILDNGGVGYFPERLVRRHISSGRMTVVEGNPSFSLPAYVVYPEQGDDDLLDVAVEGLREVAGLNVKRHSANDAGSIGSIACS